MIKLALVNVAQRILGKIPINDMILSGWHGMKWNINSWKQDMVLYSKVQKKTLAPYSNLMKTQRFVVKR